MEVSVEYLGAVQFEVNARIHKVACDQPQANGGFDEGMTPPEFLLASLGTCAGYYAVEYLKARKLPAGGLRVRVTAEKAKAPARLAAFKVEVSLPEALDDLRHDGLIRAIRACLIHNTLTHPPKIELEIVAPDGRELQAA